MYIAGLDKGVFVGLPDAVHDGRVAGIARRAMIELSAEVDDLHARPPCRELRPLFWNATPSHIRSTYFLLAMATKNSIIFAGICIKESADVAGASGRWLVPAADEAGT
jgi:hypothetical protein